MIAGKCFVGVGQCDVSVFVCVLTPVKASLRVTIDNIGRNMFMPAHIHTLTFRYALGAMCSDKNHNTQ